MEGARTLARASLAEDYGMVRWQFDDWEKWGETLQIPHASPELRHEAELSAAVLKIHEDRTYAGSIIASLSVPWGSSHDSLGGYHLVWPRDAVETALALMAVGQTEDASRKLAYLIGTQGENGAWGQNYYPDVRSYWTGVQLDQAALPVMLVGKLRASGALTPSLPLETMVRSAIGFIVRNGPMSEQDRWEENAGVTAFTLSVTIVALVASAEFLDPAERDYVLSLADCWNERIEDWTYVDGGPLCGSHQVDGYYVRIAPPAQDGGIDGQVQIRNRTDGDIAAQRQRHAAGLGAWRIPQAFGLPRHWPSGRAVGRRAGALRRSSPLGGNMALADGQPIPRTAGRARRADRERRAVLAAFWL